MMMMQEWVLQLDERLVRLAQARALIASVVPAAPRLQERWEVARASAAQRFVERELARLVSEE